MPDVKICVVGAGRWGKNHVRTLSSLGLLGGIVDPDSERLAERAAAFPETPCFSDIKQAVAHGFDGYVVATPAQTHREIAEFLLRRDNHVLVEKPIALNTGDARLLVELAEQRGVNLMVGHVLLFHPAIRKLSELIEGGKIGKLQYIYSNRANLGTVRSEENILWSFAPHDVSIFQQLIGEEPTEVVSRGGIFIQPGIHDSTMTVLRYPNNIVAHIFVSWLHPFKEHRLVVVGSKGMISFDDASEAKHLLFYEKGIDFVRGEPTKRDGPTEVIDYERVQPLTAELEYFAARLDGSPVTIASGRSGLEVLDVLERASASLLASGNDAGASKSTIEGRVHETAVIDDNVEIGPGTRVWHFSHIQSGARIGRDCTLGQIVNVANNVSIGNNVKVQNNVSIYEGVTLEDHVFCGPSMVFTNVLSPRSKYPQRGSTFYAKTVIREGASLGANCTIVCGNSVGKHAFVGAGAVVTKDVPDYALVAGVPATIRGWVCECGEKLELDGGSATCSCERSYALDGDVLKAVSA